MPLIKTACRSYARSGGVMIEENSLSSVQSSYVVGEDKPFAGQVRLAEFTMSSRRLDTILAVRPPGQPRQDGAGPVRVVTRRPAGLDPVERNRRAIHRTKKELDDERHWPTQLNCIKCSENFLKYLCGLSSDRYTNLNDKFDKLAHFPEDNRTRPLKSLDLKQLTSNPMPPSTHEFDAWVDRHQVTGSSIFIYLKTLQ
jgi:hypothetical protein